MLWLGASDGLRRYDFAAKTLSRPRELPRGEVTAVAATDSVVAVAIGARIFRSTGDAPFRALAHPPWYWIGGLALDGDDLWALGEGGLQRFGANGEMQEVLHTDIGAPSLTHLSVARGVVWAAQSGGTPAGTLVRFAAGCMDHFAHPTPGKDLFPEILVAEPGGAVMLGLWHGADEPSYGARLLRFDGQQFTFTLSAAPPPERELPPWYWQDGRLWVTEGSAFTQTPAPRAAVPTQPWPGRQAGQAVSVADLPPHGLFVMGDRRLARWADGRWTIFSAPNEHGVSVERVPGDDRSFGSATGLVLGPPSTDVAFVSSPPSLPPRKPPEQLIDGVPFYLRDPTDEELYGFGPSLEDYLPDFGPEERVRYVGVLTGDRISARGVNLPRLRVERRIGRRMPATAPALVTIEGPLVAPVSFQDEVRVRLAEPTTLVPDLAPLYRKIVAFYRQHRRALRQASSSGCWPRLPGPDGLDYDAARGQIALTLTCDRQTTRTQLTFYGRDEIEEIHAASYFVGE